MLHCNNTLLPLVSISSFLCNIWRIKRIASEGVNSRFSAVGIVGRVVFTTDNRVIMMICLYNNNYNNKRLARLFTRVHYHNTVCWKYFILSEKINYLAEMMRYGKITAYAIISELYPETLHCRPFFFHDSTRRRHSFFFSYFVFFQFTK